MVTCRIHMPRPTQIHPPPAHGSVKATSGGDTNTMQETGTLHSRTSRLHETIVVFFNRRVHSCNCMGLKTLHQWTRAAATQAATSESDPSTALAGELDLGVVSSAANMKHPGLRVGVGPGLVARFLGDAWACWESLCGDANTREDCWASRA